MWARIKTYAPHKKQFRRTNKHGMGCLMDVTNTRKIQLKWKRIWSSAFFLGGLETARAGVIGSFSLNPSPRELLIEESLTSTSWPLDVKSIILYPRFDDRVSLGSGIGDCAFCRLQSMKRGEHGPVVIGQAFTKRSILTLWHADYTE